MHDWTHSFNKDTGTQKNAKLHKHNGKTFFNDETCLMKELALPFKIFVIFHHVHSLGVHPCLLIPEISKNVGLFTTSKARNSIKFFISPRKLWGNFGYMELEYLNLNFRHKEAICEKSPPPPTRIRFPMRVPSFSGKGVLLGRLSWEDFPRKPGKGDVCLLLL